MKASTIDELVEDGILLRSRTGRLSMANEYKKILAEIGHHRPVNGDVNGEVNGYVKGGVNTLTTSQKLVFDIVRENPGIKTKRIADALNKSPRTIEKHLSFLAKANLIEHRDSDKTGGYYMKK